MKKTNNKPCISINLGKTPEERQEIDNSMEVFSQKIRDAMAKVLPNLSTTFSVF